MIFSERMQNGKDDCNVMHKRHLLQVKELVSSDKSIEIIRI